MRKVLEKNWPLLAVCIGAMLIALIFIFLPLASLVDPLNIKTPQEQDKIIGRAQFISSILLIVSLVLTIISMLRYGKKRRHK